MAMPALRPLAAAVYQQLRLQAPADEQLGWPLAHYVAAQLAPLEDLAEWVSDTIRPGPSISVLRGINLVAEPSFEAPLVNWLTTGSFRITSGAVLNRVPSGLAMSGSNVLQVDTTSGSANQGPDYKVVPVVAGVTYQVSVRVAGNAGGEALRIRIGDGAVGLVTANFTATTGMQRITATFVPSASGVTGLSVATVSAAAQRFFVDRVQVVAATTPVTEFDGDTPSTETDAYSWTGIAHLSASEHRLLLPGPPIDVPGYSVFLDIDRCPAIALPWLAQFKGVVIPGGLSEAEQRDWIRTAEGQRRGMTPALVAAGQRHLAGARTVRVLERVGGNAYALTAITRTSETPDPATTLADLKAAKRIGIVLTHVVSDDPIWDEATLAWSAVGAGVTWDTATTGTV